MQTRQTPRPVLALIWTFRIAVYGAGLVLVLSLSGLATIPAVPAAEHWIFSLLMDHMARLWEMGVSQATTGSRIVLAGGALLLVLAVLVTGRPPPAGRQGRLPGMALGLLGQLVGLLQAGAMAPVLALGLLLQPSFFGLVLAAALACGALERWAGKTQPPRTGPARPDKDTLRQATPDPPSAPSKRSSAPCPPGGMGLTLATLILAGACAVLACSMLSTDAIGTIYDWLADLAGCPASGSSLARAAIGLGLFLACPFVFMDRKGPGRVKVTIFFMQLAFALTVGAIHALWLGLAGGAVAAGLASLGLGGLTAGARRGLPLLPDPWSRPALWPTQLLLPTLAGLISLTVNLAADLPSCPDAAAPGVTRIAPECAAFSMDATSLDRGEALLGLVLREKQLVRVREQGGPDSPGRVLFEHRLADAHPEEALALPGKRSFVFTAVPRDLMAERTRLLVVRFPKRGTGPVQVKDHRPVGLCWVSSIAWDPGLSALLLGCEERGRLFHFWPESGRLSPPADLAGEGDVEDIWLDAGHDRLYVAQLTHDRLLLLDRRSLRTLRSLRLGGMSYSVVLDGQLDRLYLSRFYESSVVALDASDLSLVSRARTGLGTRALALLEGPRLLVASSMFHSCIHLISLDTGRPVRCLRLGGRIKVARASGRDDLLVSTSCGTFRVHLPSLLAPRVHPDRHQGSQGSRP